MEIRTERKSVPFSPFLFNFGVTSDYLLQYNIMQTVRKVSLYFFFPLFFSIFSPLSERSDPRSALSDFSARLPSLRVPSSVDEVVGWDCPHLAISSCSLILAEMLEIQPFISSCIPRKKKKRKKEQDLSSALSFEMRSIKQTKLNLKLYVFNSQCHFCLYEIIRYG